MQRSIVAIEESPRLSGIGEASALQERRQREVQILGDEQIREELEELRIYLDVAGGGGMMGRDRLKAPGPRRHPTLCGFAPLPPYAPERAPPTRRAAGWR